MKRLLAIALTLSTASCDTSTTTADGTSSETQTSLRALATRLDGIRVEASAARAAAFAARMVDPSTEEWQEDPTWDVWSSVSYAKDRRARRWFSQRSDSLVAISSDTYFREITNTDVTGQTRNEYLFREHASTCSDPSGARPLPVTTCAVILPGTMQAAWNRIEFRNGMTLATIDSTTSLMQAFVVDGRWTLRDSKAHGNDEWWEIHENGHLVGYGRLRDRLGTEYQITVFENPSLETISRLEILDLVGNTVSPDRSQPGEWTAFPEDSLGLSIESVVLDSLASRMRLGISWRFKPGVELPLDTLATLSVYVTGDSCDESWKACYFKQVSNIHIQAARGNAALEVSLDSIVVRNPSELRVAIESRRDPPPEAAIKKIRKFYASVAVDAPKAGWPSIRDR